jgi:mannose-6-phosphate isomerase-like protein (cupin superfamily)
MITRRDILVASLSVAITAVVAAAVVAQPNGRPLMRSSFFEWNALKVTPTKTGERRDIFDSPTATLDRFECHATTLNPGEAPHPAHKHVEEELLIIKEGTLETVQNGQTNSVGAGGIVFEASNEPHGIRNVGTNSATYYVLKWYPPGSAKAKSQ